MKFCVDAVIALCGAEFEADVDGQQISFWETVPVSVGSTLTIKEVSITNCKGPIIHDLSAPAAWLR